MSCVLSARAAERFLLVLILLGAAGTRMVGLGRESLWVDELQTWHKLQHSSLAAVVEQGVRPDVHPPGFEIVLALARPLIGETEAALRLPSAIAGVLSVWLIFRLGRRWLSGAEGLIAAGLLAAAWTPVYYAREARANSLLLLFSIVTMSLWEALLRRWERGEAAPAGVQLGYVLAALVTAYLHYFGLLFVALQAAGLLLLVVRRRGPWRRVVRLYAVFAVGFLPWVPAMLEQHGQLATYWIPKPTPAAVGSFWGFMFAAPPLLYALTVALGVAAWARRATRPGRYPRPTSPTWLLIAWLVVPFAVVFVLSTVSSSILNNRNLILSLPAAYLLVARSVTSLFGRPAVRAAIGGGLVTVAAWGLVSGELYSRPHHDQIREAVAKMADVGSDLTDPLTIAVTWAPAEVFDYYLRPAGLGSVAVAFSGDEQLAEVEAAQRQRPGRAVWVLVAHQEPPLSLLEHLGRGAEVVYRERLQGAEVLLFRPGSDLPPDTLDPRLSGDEATPRE